MSYITIKLRRGTAAQWTAQNPVLAEGEVGLETDTRKFKAGDGTTAWTGLQYYGGSGGGASTFITLSDVPQSYTGQGGKLVRVKADASGLEFYTLTIAAGDLPAGIDAAKIGSGNVSNTEFSYLDGVTSAIQTQLNSKQASLGYTAEDVANKSTSVTTDQASNTKYPSVKAVYDWAVATFTTTAAVASQITSALSGYATQAWVTSQGYITNVITALGYTPENSANKKTTLADNSDTFYPTQKAVKTAVDAKQDALGFTAENVANKSTSVTTDQASNTKYPSVKAVYDWVVGLGYITNVVTALGYTPENQANKKTTLSDNSDTFYPSQKAVKTAVDAKQDTLVSGTNIKTINGNSVLGSGDLTISAGADILEIQVFS